MIHLISHWVEQIHWYGALQQYSAKKHEQAHKTNHKNGWNASNYNLNYLPQVITFQRSILWFEIREINLQCLAQCQENSTATYKVFPSGADLAAPLSPQSYAKPQCIGPQNCRDGIHPDAMNKHFRALLNNTQDTTHLVPIYSSMRGFIKHKSCNKMYISDELLHTMELCIYHGIKVQVEGCNGERISQMRPCTGSQNWHGGDRRNHCVWVKAMPREVWWRTEWASPMATAMTINNQTPKQGLTFRWVLVSPGPHHITWKLWSLTSGLEIYTSEKTTDSRFFASIPCEKHCRLGAHNCRDSY